MVKGNKATDPPIMIDPFHPPHVGPHSLGDFSSSSGTSTGTSDGSSIAAETVYYTARCAGGCSWRGNDYQNDKRPAMEEATQHQADYPGHTATVDERKAPT